MAIELPLLPYPMDALEPFITKRTIEFHYGKHHQAYVTNINKLIVGTEFEKATLEDMIKKASGGIFNNGAQVWNHTFYWNCLKPHVGGEPKGPLAQAINKNFGSFEQFKENILLHVQPYSVQDGLGLLRKLTAHLKLSRKAMQVIL